MKQVCSGKQKECLSVHSCSTCPSLKFNSEEEMVHSFQRIYRAQFGEEISYQEAFNQGMQLINSITYINPELYAIKKQSCITN